MKCCLSTPSTLLLLPNPSPPSDVVTTSVSFHPSVHVSAGSSKDFQIFLIRHESTAVAVFCQNPRELQAALRRFELPTTEALWIMPPHAEISENLWRIRSAEVFR